MTTADNTEGSRIIGGRITRRRALGLVGGAALGSILAAFPEPRTATSLQTGWDDLLKGAVKSAPKAAKLMKGVLEGAVSFDSLLGAWNKLWDDGDSNECKQLYNTEVWNVKNAGGFSCPRASQRTSDKRSTSSADSNNIDFNSMPTSEEAKTRLYRPPSQEKVISSGLTKYAPSAPTADTWLTLRGKLLQDLNFYTERAARNDHTAALDNAMLVAFLYMQWWLTNAYVKNPSYYQNVRYPEENYRRFFTQYGNAVQRETPALQGASSSEIQGWADRFYLSLNKIWNLPQLSYKEAAMFTFAGSLALEDRKLVSQI